MVRIRRSHRRGPGSIPGVGTFHFLLLSEFDVFFIAINVTFWVKKVPFVRVRDFAFRTDQIA